MRQAWMVTCALAALVAVGSASGCEDVSPSATDAGVTPGGGGDATVAPPDGSGVTCEAVKVDLLWVVDNSTSMCQEQAALADGFTEFHHRLGLYGHIDLRTAVTTTAVLIDSQRGRFSGQWAEEFPPLCQEERLFPARSDLHCECAACAGWDESFAYQCGQDASPSPSERGCVGGDPSAAAPAYVQCLEAGGCADNDLAALWVWEPPSGGVALTYNLNGTVNSSCQLYCGMGQSTVAEARERGTAICQEWFGDDRSECQVPDLQRTGCIRPPDTADCPDGLPTVLPAVAADGEVTWGLDWFRCLATVGADQSTAANLEGGLAAAWLTLSEDGPAPTQVCEPGDPALGDASLTPAQQRAQCARRFLREDAWLVIAIVSDEDDCSLADGRRIVVEDYNRCALLGDDETEPLTEQNANTDDRPLATVTTFVERLRALTPDPQKVVVAAFVGDARDPLRPLTEEEVEAARERYFASKADRDFNRLALNTSIASGPMGRADLGLRYIQLVGAFGDRGFFHNIVLDLPGELTAFAEEIGALVSTCE